MQNAVVYIAAIMFFMGVFPLHVYNYVYVNSGEGYTSINVTMFRYIKIFNANTVKNSFAKMQINGKEKPFKISTINKSFYKIFNCITLNKIVQLADVGVQSDNNAYIALTHNALTNAVYTFITTNGGKAKLKNYTILNYEHDKINYYGKVVAVINLIVVLKIIFIIITEKFNERKN